MLRLAAGDANVLSGRYLSVEEALKGALSRGIEKGNQFRHLELLARPRKIISETIQAPGQNDWQELERLFGRGKIQICDTLPTLTPADTYSTPGF